MIITLLKLKTVFLSFILLVALTANAQLFNSKETLYTGSAFSGWYTGNEYSAVKSHAGVVYFHLLDPSRRPMIGKIENGVTTIEPLEKNEPSYKPYDDGHHEYSIGVDKNGYIHVAGDMHNFPEAEASNIPASFDGSTILYWKSKQPGDISDFEFLGKNTAERIPGTQFSYGHFITDRYGELYFLSRTLARNVYWQNGGRGLGLYRYNTSTKSWVARGVLVPKTDASHPVIAWQESGQNGGSYQQYKADIQFDINNRMYLTTGMNTENGPAQVNSIIFAYSDDEGINFKRMDGSAITLPMRVASGANQADVISSNVSQTYEQPSVTYAFDNAPVVMFNRSGQGYFKYWTGSSWSGENDLPFDSNRGRVIFNDHTQQLIFVHVQSGTLHARSSFTGTTTTYDAGETFRYFDIHEFQKSNELIGVSWKASTGSFQVIKLKGDEVTPADCAGVPGGSAIIDMCGVCTGGSTGLPPCQGALQGESPCFFEGTIDTDNLGYQGDGYLNSPNIMGASAFWTFESEGASTVPLHVRFANQSATNRTVDVYLNNVLTLNSLSFEGTGSWTNWAVTEMNLDFIDGINTVEFVATTDEGMANIDQFSIGGPNVRPGQCVILAKELLNTETDLRLYPNPATNQVMFSKSTNWKLISSQGVVLDNGNGVQLPLNNYPEGVYFVNTNEQMHRLVKQ